MGVVTIMRRLLFALLAALAVAGPADAGEKAGALAQALAAAAEGDWEEATRLARGAGPIGRDIVLWQRLRAGEGTAREYLDFLARRSDWPGLPLLRRRGETALADAPALVERLLAGEPPKTPEGALAIARARLARGDRSGAEAVAARAWQAMSMSPELEEAFLREFGRALRKHHAARADALLWAGDRQGAARMIPRLGPGRAALVRARIALQRGAQGVDALISRIPRRLAGDPGLAFDRFRWRLARGRFDAAAALLLERSRAASLGRPDAWVRGRLRLVREMMQAGRWRTAWELAAYHGLESGGAAAELEWLAGYIALARLGDAPRAAGHFRRLAGLVVTPISRARAGYWLGLAEEARGAPAAAAAAFAEAARWQTAYYGQLAAEHAGVPPDPALAGTERYPDWRRASFRNSSVLEAGLLLLAAGERRLGARFLAHLAESLPPAEMGSLADLALARGEPHAAVIIGKRAASMGHQLVRPLFPLTRLAEKSFPVPTELALAIARRESEFRVDAESRAGARGLMQLMPGTARDMAEELGLDYLPARLLTDWDYNATLAGAYLGRLYEEYGGNLALVAAAYNAGPARVSDWIGRFGDPRDPEVDPVHWVEAIPFAETRNYVMRVAESVAVYRARLAGRATPLGLGEALGRGADSIAAVAESPRPLPRPPRRR